MTLELVDAWRAWDHACLVISRRGEAAAKKNRIYRPPTGALRKETDALVDAEIAVAEVVGCSHMVLHDRIVEGKRSGLTTEDAVASAVAGWCSGSTPAP